MRFVKLGTLAACVLFYGLGASAAEESVVEFDDAGALLAPVDHYRCYQAQQRDPKTHQAGIHDVFLSGDRQLLGISQICAPVRKIRGDLTPPEDLVPRFPLAHLTCYRLEPQERADVTLAFKNQFERDRMRVGAENSLCVPALKRHLPISETDGYPSFQEAHEQLKNVDHYRCYRAQQQTPRNQLAVLRDQFLGPDQRAIRQLVQFCTPARKVRAEIGEELNPLFPRIGLACYVLRPRDSAGAQVRTWNQFETTDLEVREERTLCVPTLTRSPNGGDA